VRASDVAIGCAGCIQCTRAHGIQGSPTACL